jgi:hypothetical protein
MDPAPILLSETHDGESSKIDIVEITLEDLLHPDSQNPIRVGIVAAYTSFRGSDMVSILNSVLEASSSKKYDIVVAPEYSFSPEEGLISEEGKDVYVETFRKASENGTMIIPGTFVWQNGNEMFNTAYVFYDGKVIHRYDKMRDAFEGGIAERNNLVLSLGQELGVFQWAGLNVGIEICADAGILGASGIKDRDLVFLISCGKYQCKESMESVKVNGYVIMAEGQFEKYLAKQRTRLPEPIEEPLSEPVAEKSFEPIIEPSVPLKEIVKEVIAPYLDSIRRPRDSYEEGMHFGDSMIWKDPFGTNNFGHPLFEDTQDLPANGESVPYAKLIESIYAELSRNAKLD